MKTSKTVLPVIAALVIAVSGCGKSQSDAPKTEETAQEVVKESAPEPSAQVFDSDLATIEFKGLQDVNPYVYVPFMLTNKTGTTIDVYPSDNMVVNDQYNVTMLGGSSPLSPIEPGNTGAVTFSLALEQQTGLTDMSEIHSISGDFKLCEAGHISNVVGLVHVDVTI